MVGVRGSIGTSLVPQPGASPRSETAKAAQKAFFQAALNAPTAAAPQAALSTVAATTTATPVRPTVRPQAIDPDNPPSRPLRPGSLLDITV